MGNKEKESNTVKKCFGMKKKLLAIIIPVITVALIVLILIAFYTSKNSIKEKTEKLMEQTGVASVNQIASWESDNLTTLTTAVDSILYLEMDDDEILEYEGQYLGTYDDFPNGMYIAYEDGKVLDASGWEPEGDVTQSSWYQEGMEHEDFAFGEPYQDALTGEYIVTASRKVPDLNGKTAVVAADVSLSILSDLLKNMEVAGNGDAFIIDSKSGIILAHLDSDLIGKNVSECKDKFYQEILTDISAENSIKTSYDSKDGSYMVSAENIQGTSWYIVSRGLEKNIYKDVTNLRNVLILVCVLTILILGIIMSVLIQRITTPIRKITNTISAVADGDFTTSVEVKGNDEVAYMADSMKKFLTSMRHILNSIAVISNNIDDQAQTSNQVSSDLNNSANGQAEAMGQMRQTLEELVKSITVIAENATTLAQVVAGTNEAGNEALNDLGATISEATQGREGMTSVTCAMDEVKEGMHMLGKSISNVGAAAIKINEITNTIRGIAEETNLLALNASIEAARAGEAGKGFAVVATQIKNLAENSAAAAGEISELIDSVTELIQETVNRSETSMEQINQSANMVSAATEQFDHIYESIEHTNEIVLNMIEQIRDVNDVASNMASITEEQSASAEEIEASVINIQELSETVSENSADVYKDAKELASTADTLKQHISQFTI